MRSSLRLDLELLTPAFVGAADPRRLDPYMPLRPSAVRGVLRWWFRAAAAALMWPADGSPGARALMEKALRKAEASVFGDTEHASPLVVLPPRGGAPHRYDPLPDPAESPGLRYLGYGLFEDRLNPPEALVTDAQRPLSITLGLRRPLAGAEELIHAVLWLWLFFGGIGARSRRGFGALRLVGHEGHLCWPAELREPPATHQGLVDMLLRGLDWVTGVFRDVLPGLCTYQLETGSGPHPAIRTLDGISTVTVLPIDAPSGEAALERAGRLFRDFRSTLQRRRLGMPPLRDYFAVKASLDGRSSPSSVDRAAFGLPLRFYFRSLQGAQTQFTPKAGDRLASPLCFRVHALARGGERCRFVVTLFNLAEANGASPLLGQPLVQQGRDGAIAAPDGALLQQFVTWAAAQAARSPEARRGGRP